MEQTKKEFVLEKLQELEALVLNLPKNRETSLVITKLQEAHLWLCCGGGPKLEISEEKLKEAQRKLDELKEN